VFAKAGWLAGLVGLASWRGQNLNSKQRALVGVSVQCVRAVLAPLQMQSLESGRRARWRPCLHTRVCKWAQKSGAEGRAIGKKLCFKRGTSVIGSPPNVEGPIKTLSLSLESLGKSFKLPSWLPTGPLKASGLLLASVSRAEEVGRTLVSQRLGRMRPCFGPFWGAPSKRLARTFVRVWPQTSLLGLQNKWAASSTNRQTDSLRVRRLSEWFPFGELGQLSAGERAPS